MTLALHVPKKALFVRVRHILIGVTKPLRASYTSTKLYNAALKTYYKQVTAAHAKAQKVFGCSRQAATPTLPGRRLRLSTQPIRKQDEGGLYTWAQASTYVPSFAHASETWALDTDNIVRSRYGFHVLEVLGRRTQTLTSQEYRVIRLRR